MILIARGRVFATPSAITVLVDGNEVLSGQVGTGQPLDTETTFLEYNWGEPTPPGAVTPVSISVTSGVVSIGPWFVQAFPGQTTEFGPDVRQNILVNGALPEWPATPVTPMPGGTPENPDWYGWFFELGAGETITFNLVNPIT